MSASLVDRTIAALHHEHDVLEALLPNLPDNALAAPSGASEWTVAQALSHLGSSAEITRKPLARAAGEPVEEEDDRAVWARWDSSSPVDQAAGFVRHDTAYLETVDGLTPEQRETLTVDLGFLPEPVPVVVALGMRLNEVAAHSWDVRVGLDPAAEVTDQSAEVLVEHFQSTLAFLLGFSTKPGEVSEQVRLAVPGGGVLIDDGVTVVAEAADPTATLEGAPGATVRLLTGRLRTPYDAAVSVSGNVSLDELRRVFPGY